jgi:phosphoribosylglycinamide formyltransferase-1
VARMMTLGILVSGGGSNLQAILDAVATKALDARVAVVVSNVAQAFALERAGKAGVHTVFIDHGTFADRRAFDAEVVRVLREHEVDLVVLAGFMRLVTDVLLDAYPMRVVNVHPGLLPAFPGIHAQKQALDHGVRVAGCTVHFVDRGTDSGPIIAQAAVPVLETDNEATLTARILAKEHELLPRAIQWIVEGRVAVEPALVPGARARVRVRGVSASLGVA